MNPSLAILTFLVLLAAGCERREKFPITSVEQASVVEEPDRWQHVTMVGSRDGPFRNLGGHVLNANANAKRVSFTVDGRREEQDLSALKGEVLLRRFENPKGDSLVLVYTQRKSRK